METTAVLGASGGLGKAVVDALIRRNVHTKILVRDIEKYKALYPNGAPLGRVDVIEGDIDNNQALARLMEGIDTVFLCINTSYRYWKERMPRWIDRISNIASTIGAHIIFPGNVYVFGKTGEKLIDEEYPMQPQTEKGQLRVALESRMMRAAQEGATLTIIRFPDFYGPAVLNKLMDGVFKAAINDKKGTWFGNPYILHDFIFVEDAGEAMVLAALNEKSKNQIFHVPGPKAITSNDWINLIYTACNSQLEKKYRIISNWLISLIGIIDKEAKEFREMLYLFETPLIMDGSKFKTMIGDLNQRDYLSGINQTIEWFRYWLSRDND